MLIVNKVRDLLQKLEEAIPPPPNAHHCITYAQQGSDSAGWEDKLALQINVKDKFYCFFLEDKDFDFPQRCIEYIGKTLLDSGKIASMQEGVGPGQYIS